MKKSLADKTIREMAGDALLARYRNHSSLFRTERAATPPPEGVPVLQLMILLTLFACCLSYGKIPRTRVASATRSTARQ